MKQKIISQNGKSFSDDYPEEYAELISYQKIMDDQYFFQNRLKYIFLIEGFLERKVTEHRFVFKFDRMYDEDRQVEKNISENLEQLEKFWIDSKFQGFFELITEVNRNCFKLDPDWYETFTDDNEDEDDDIDILMCIRENVENVYVIMKRFD